MDMISLVSGIVIVGNSILGGYYRSDDYGETWSDHNPHIGDATYHGSFCDIGGGGILVSGDDDHLYLSEDYGVTWDILADSPDELYLDMVHLGSGLVIGGTGSGKIYHSDDYGATWTLTTTLDDDGATTIDLIRDIGDGVLLAVVNPIAYPFPFAFPAKIYRSEDYGITWEVVLTQINSDTIINDCVHQGEGYIVAGASIQADTNLVRSTDYGLTWEVFNPYIIPYGGVVRILALDEYTILYSQYKSIYRDVSSWERRAIALMDADEREIFGKVEITFTDPSIDENVTITATDTAYNTFVTQTADGYLDAEYKWFGLGNGAVLDGTYHPMPTEDVGSVGWWSESKSDASSNFNPPMVLSVEFDVPRPIYSLMVVGDSKLDEHPVDFTVQCSDVSSTVVYSEEVTGNTLISWSKSIGEVAEDGILPTAGYNVGTIKTLTLTITKWSKPNAQAKISEFFSAFSQVYEGDDLISIKILEETAPDSATIPMGNASSNEITIRFNNIDRKFDPGNTTSILYGMMTKNRRIRAWLGMRVSPYDEDITWYPMGIFWSQDWSSPENEAWAEVTGWDRLEFIRTSDYPSSEVYENITLYELAEKIFESAKVLVNEYWIDPMLDTIIIPYGWIDHLSHLEALKKIAAAINGRLYCNRIGQVILEPYTVPGVTSYCFTRNNFFSKDHPLAWTQICNFVEVHSSPLEPDVETEIYVDTTPFVVPSRVGSVNGSVEKFCIFNTSPVCFTDITTPVVISGPDISVGTTTLYSWAGRIFIENSTLYDRTCTGITITGKPLVKTGSQVATAFDTESFLLCGRQAAPVIENDLIQSFEHAQVVADAMLTSYKDPRRDIALNAMGNILLELGEAISVPDYLDTSLATYTVRRQEITWDGSLRVDLAGRRCVLPSVRFGAEFVSHTFPESVSGEDFNIINRLVPVTVAAIDKVGGDSEVFGESYDGLNYVDVISVVSAELAAGKFVRIGGIIGASGTEYRCIESVNYTTKRVVFTQPSRITRPWTYPNTWPIVEITKLPSTTLDTVGGCSTVTTNSSSVGTTTLILSSVASLAAGSIVRVDDPTDNGVFEYAIIASLVSGTKTITLTAPLLYAHYTGASVVQVTSLPSMTLDTAGGDSTTIATASVAGASTLVLTAAVTPAFGAGAFLRIGNPTNSKILEYATVESINYSTKTITFTSPLVVEHTVLDPVVQIDAIPGNPLLSGTVTMRNIGYETWTNNLDARLFTEGDTGDCVIQGFTGGFLLPPEKMPDRAKCLPFQTYNYPIQIALDGTAGTFHFPLQMRWGSQEYRSRTGGGHGFGEIVDLEIEVTGEGPIWM